MTREAKKKWPLLRAMGFQGGHGREGLKSERSERQSVLCGTSCGFQQLYVQQIREDPKACV